MQRLDLAAEILEFFDLYDSGIGDRLLVARSLTEWADLVHEYFAGTHVCFKSSGSLGESSVHEHALQVLRAEAEAHAEYLKAERVIMLAPLHHIYGFIWGVLLPEILAVPVLEGTPAVRAVHRDLQAGDLIVAPPLWWKHLAQAVKRFPADVCGITSTAPLPTPVWDDLLTSGLHTLHEIYGASELAGIGCRQHWTKRFELLAPWQGLTACGQRLVDRAGRISAELPDHLDFAAPRSFSIIKRKDRKVQVAGYNVSPLDIAARLKTHTLVLDCQVRLMRPDEGDRLKAQVVTRHETSPEQRAEFRRWCHQNLLAHERPSLTFTTKASVNEMGKFSDWHI
ncbi:MAG: hypothetical protein ACFHXK_20260 [bacterium]